MVRGLKCFEKDTIQLSRFKIGNFSKCWTRIEIIVSLESNMLENHNSDIKTNPIMLNNFCSIGLIN